ncbi:MAG: ribokinase [Bacteroidales bacterium]|nr:ribokinase [Bacteroidales bacterium]
MAQPNIIVIGSSNTDMVVQSDHLPVPGETVLGGEFFMNPGGKGANQAVAASRFGGNVVFISKLGKDIFGEKYLDILGKEKINTDYVYTDPDSASGVALITVDSKGENAIVVAPGANSILDRSDIDQAEKEFGEAEFILMQLEIPLDTVIYAARKASALDRQVVLNPAPAQELPDELLSALYIITPNETEAEMLSGVRVKDIGSARSAAQVIRNKGVNVVIITIGSRGAYIFSDEVEMHVPASEVTAKDTTAAGDVFNGALVVALAEQLPLSEAVQLANNAASLSVTKLGAQASAPYREELR